MPVSVFLALGARSPPVLLQPKKAEKLISKLSRAKEMANVREILSQKCSFTLEFTGKPRKKKAPPYLKGMRNREVLSSKDGCDSQVEIARPEAKVKKPL